MDEILVDKYYHLKSFHCLNENFKQLDRKFRLLENSDVKHKYQKIKNEYENALFKNDQKDYKNLIINFRTLMKSLVNQNSESNQNYNQIYLMEISLIAMLIVSKFE
jgi:hypothetical protein